jgi:TPR repeat protein
MQDLTPLQRDVVNAIALNWDAVSPEEIARKTRLSANNVLTVLYELEKVFIVQQVAGDPQQPLYQLNERFFNIWYLMRLAPGTNRSKVLWLLHFLESWYNKQELTQRAKQHTDAVATGRYTAKDAYYLTEAFAKTGQLDMDTEYYMISETKRLLQELDADLAGELSPADKEIFEKARQFCQQGDYGQAVDHYATLKHKNAYVCLQIGDSFEKLGDYQRAAEYFARAGEQGHVDALVHLGQIYQHRLHDYPSAEMAYAEAARQGNIEAMLALANLYYSTLKDYQKAEHFYLRVIKAEQSRSTVLTSSKFSLQALKSYLVTAIKGTTQDTAQYKFKDFSGTKEHYLQMLHKAKVEAAFQLGNLYTNELENLDLAETYYTMAVESGHVMAMVNLGYLYHYSRKVPRKAITWYTQAIEHGEIHYAAANLGILYQHELHDYSNAERYYLIAIENGDTGAMNGLAWLYFEQTRHKDRALEYASQAFEQTRNIYTAHTLACTYLWHNRIERAMKTAQEFLYHEEAYANLEQDILFFLMLLLAKEQYQVIYEYFATPEMVFPERFKPLYYAYLHLINDPDAQKLPLELTEPVQDLVKQIEQLAKQYA